MMAWLAVKNYFRTKNISDPEELRTRFLAYDSIHNFSHKIYDSISIQSTEQGEINEQLKFHKEKLLAELFRGI